MEKPKRKAKTSDYDFSFIAPLSLEECAYRIENRLLAPTPASLGLERNYYLKSRVKRHSKFTIWFGDAIPTRLEVLPRTPRIVGYLNQKDNENTMVYGYCKPNRMFYSLMLMSIMGFFIILSATPPIAVTLYTLTSAIILLFCYEKQKELRPKLIEILQKSLQI